MSGLAAILASHKEPGVFQWHSAASPEDVRHTVEHAGWQFGYVDGWTHQDKGALLDAFAETFDFPKHFGHNFDALLDSLRDLSEPTVVLWDGWGPLAREDAQAFGVAIDVLNQRATEDPSFPFAVLMRGDGPQVDVASLD